MDRGEPSPTRRKSKFTPKAPPNRKPKPPPHNIIGAADERSEDKAKPNALLHSWNEKAEKPEFIETKSSVQVVFGPVETTTGPAWKNKRDYKEPWDCHNSFHPTTLPLRKPYSGDPGSLDEEEFGEAAISKEYDENTVKSAAELGLSEKSKQPRMLFLQLPPALPLAKQPVSKKGKEIVGTSTVSRESIKGTPLEELLPQGYMGKMLVYKSGAIKLKLGETLFDVSPGSNIIFAQDAVVINTAEKHCCVLGELGKLAVVTPDFDNLWKLFDSK